MGAYPPPSPKSRANANPTRSIQSRRTPPRPTSFHPRPWQDPGDRVIAGYKAQCALLAEPLTALVAASEAACQSLVCEGGPGLDVRV